MTESLDATEAVSAKGATHPRVTLDDIKNNISGLYFVTGYDVVSATHIAEPQDELKMLTICMLVMKNGFVILGKSAPASPENFDAEKGRTFAYEDGVRQLWPLMGYALKEQLSHG